MKRILWSLLAVSPLLISACTQPEVVTEAVIEQDGEAVALSDLPVRLLPYDRDAIFDSLEAAFPEPEPELPPELAAQQTAVQEAQAEWRAAEERWSTVRDSLRTLSEELQRMQDQGLRTTPQYTQLFQRFNTLEGEEQRVNQEMEQAFQTFTQLQQATLEQSDSVRVVREAWADRAYEDFDQIIAARLEASGVEELADTTNAQGMAVFNAPEGQWWVYARYTLPYQELYWNIPIEVTGDSMHVRLTEANAEQRPVM